MFAARSFGARSLALTIALSAGCGAGSTPPPAPATGAAKHEPPPSEFQAALKRAREARRASDSIAFKPPGGDADLSTEQGKAALASWIMKRQAATVDAERAYDDALEHASPSEQIAVRRELGDLYLAFFDAKMRAALALLPAAARRDPENVAVARVHLVRIFARDAANARASYVNCLMLSNQLGLSNDESARCNDQISVIDALNPKSKRDATLEEWRFLKLEAGQRKRQPVAQKAQCVLSGSADTSWTKLYVDANGPDYFLVLSDFDVVALELPERTGQRAKISIEYPFRASGYIDADSGVVVTARRIELLEGHLWLDPETIVSAFGPASGKVTIERKSDKTTPQVALRVPCADLALPGVRRPNFDDPKGETSQVSGVVPLLAAPNGRAIGRLHLDLGLNVRVLERRHGFAHVTTTDSGVGFGAAPYEFDAWIAERFVPPGKEGFGIAVLQQQGRTPSLVTTALLPLRLAPDPASPVVARLEPQVALLVGGEQNGMSRIRFNEGHGHNEGNDFWVTAADLAANTTPWQ